MPSTKLTKSVVDTARPTARDYEIRDTIVPGFLCKITPAGRKTFMLSYRTPKGERRKPALGTYGQITVDQARKLAQDFLASIRGGADPSHERQIARTAPTVKDLSDRFMVEHSEARNKPSTVKGNRITLKAHVLPALGKVKVADVKRSDVADLVGRLRDRPTAASRYFAKCSTWPNFGAYDQTARTHAGTSQDIPARSARASSPMASCPVSTPTSTTQTPKAWNTRFSRSRSGCSSTSPPECPRSSNFNGSGSTLPIAVSFGPTARPAACQSRSAPRPRCCAAPRYAGSKFVVPALFDGSKPMSKHTYWAGWRRILGSGPIMLAQTG